MEITLSSVLPKTWIDVKPIESYETQFLYTGFSRYNTAKKSLSQLVRKEDGTIWYSDAPCTTTVFPRAYATESARITIYSVSPRVWKEEVGLSDVQVFIQRVL
jgi:hypothetical protein